MGGSPNRLTGDPHPSQLLIVLDRLKLRVVKTPIHPVSHSSLLHSEGKFLEKVVVIQRHLEIKIRLEEEVARWTMNECNE